MNIEEELLKLKKEIEKLTSTVTQSKKYFAIVENNGKDDKDGTTGKVQLRVAGVHPASKKDLPTEKLPWSKVILPTGSGGGIGQSINMQIGQWVEVESANPSSSSWKVIRNVAAVPDSESGDEAYGNVAEGNDNKLSKDIIFHIKI